MLFLKKLFTKDGIDSREPLFPHYRFFNEGKNHIYPWIKVTYPFSRENCRDAVHQLFQGENMPVFQFWLDDLCVFYAVEKGNRYEFLLQRDLPKGMDLDAVHHLATSNLDREITFDIEKASFGGYMLVGERSHESASVFLPHVWKWVCGELNDNLVVGIPSKDLVFISREKDVDSLANMKIQIHEHFKKGDRLLTRNVFRVDRQSLEWTLEGAVGKDPRPVALYR